MITWFLPEKGVRSSKGLGNLYMTFLEDSIQTIWNKYPVELQLRLQYPVPGECHWLILTALASSTST